jgi:hypothetical protein
MSEAAESAAPPEPKRWWFEPATAILMAVASLATAWCSYQSSRWSGQSSTLATQANNLERQAMALHLESQQVQSVQLHLAMEAVDATMQGNEKLAAFYVSRFASELKPAWGKWIALKPFDDPAAPPSPFAPGLYTPRYEQEILSDRTEAKRAGAEANTAGSYASGYLGNTVVLASVLFFAGTMGKFHQRHVRWFSLTFAIALFLYAAVRMFMLPVA